MKFKIIEINNGLFSVVSQRRFMGKWTTLACGFNTFDNARAYIEDFKLSDSRDKIRAFGEKTKRVVEVVDL